MPSGQDELARTITTLLLKEPFYGHVLAQVVRVVSERATPTAAVRLRNQRIELVINPAFFLNDLQNAAERLAVIKHETLHLVLRHLFRLTGDVNHTCANLAADLVVNQLIAPSGTLPQSAITLQTFADLGLSENQTTEHYYHRLSELLRELREACVDPSKPTPAEFQRTSAPQSAETLHRLLAARWHSDHEGWTASDDFDAGTIDRVVCEAARRSHKGQGQLPYQVREAITAAQARRQSSTDWKRVLRLFGASSRRTRIVSTLMRQSKRYGTHPGTRIQRLQRIAVALDTSGSMDAETLSLLFEEVHALWRRGADIEIIEVDDVVQRVYPYTGRVPESVQGRGGTCFDPTFEHLLRLPQQRRVDGCIYLTDGYGPMPSVRPPCKVLWALTPQSDLTTQLPYGPTILIRQ